MAELREHIIGEGEGETRVDVVLAAAWGESRTQVQRWLEEGRIEVDGAALGRRARVKSGKRVVATIPDPEPDGVEAEELPLKILYEDEFFIVIDKAPGMVVHPGSGCRRGTLVAALLHHCRGQLSGIGGVERPGIVHRLDKDTSGVMVAAKDDVTHRMLSDAFARRDVRKRYLAFVEGIPRPSDGEWLGRMGRHPVARHKMAVLAEGGRSARSQYRTERTWSHCSLLEVELHTGRTHQIRVHAAHAGHPLLGDETYGNRKEPFIDAPIPRQLLHARRLELSHPGSGERLEFLAPVPDDFREFESWLETQSP